MGMYVSGLWWMGRAHFFVLLLVPGILGWGDEGHYATCKIAQGYLTEEALAAVKRLLPESAGGDLAAVCSWPDDVRRTPNYRWSAGLHFVNPPDFECNYNYSRDCHDSAGNKDKCISAAIYNYTLQLSTAYTNDSSALESKYNLTEALLFLSHFIGDIHQPLHVGFIGDKGGNSIVVYWYQNTTTLHRVWDDNIIYSALNTFYDSDLTTMIQSIQRNITDGWLNEVSSWETCPSNYIACPDPYASESISLACKYAYKNAPPGSTLRDDYFLSRLPIVEKRLAQGGIRLAATLNRIFTLQSNIADA